MGPKFASTGDLVDDDASGDERDVARFRRQLERVFLEIWKLDPPIHLLVSEGDSDQFPQRVFRLLADAGKFFRRGVHRRRTTHRLAARNIASFRQHVGDVHFPLQPPLVIGFEELQLHGSHLMRSER